MDQIEKARFQSSIYLNLYTGHLHQFIYLYRHLTNFSTCIRYILHTWFEPPLRSQSRNKCIWSWRLMLLNINYKHKSLHLQLLFNCRAFSISIFIYMFTSIGRGTITYIYTDNKLWTEDQISHEMQIINKWTKSNGTNGVSLFVRIGCVCSFTHTTFQLTPREKCTNWHRNERSIVNQPKWKAPT